MTAVDDGIMDLLDFDFESFSYKPKNNLSKEDEKKAKEWLKMIEDADKMEKV